MIDALPRNTDDQVVEVAIRAPRVDVECLTRLVHQIGQAALPRIPDASLLASPQQLAAFASFIISARRRRDTTFSTIEFGEAAWDMLLDLYVQHVAKRRVCVSSLCTAAAVPPTTALRWIDVMVRRGHFLRYPDPQDGRRVHVGLAPALLAAIEAYLSDTRRRAVVALL